MSGGDVEGGGDLGEVLHGELAGVASVFEAGDGLVADTCCLGQSSDGQSCQ